MVVNIHAGHNPDGMVACGACGMIKESTEARKVVKYVKKYLKKNGCTVYDCTVNDGCNQSDVLKKIINNCNSHKADLDVSIHFNAGVNDFYGNCCTSGTEVLVYSKYSVACDYASQVLYRMKQLGFRSRGIKVRTDLFYLKNTKAPAMLIECCFVDDKDDVKLYRAKKTAKAIAEGILNRKTKKIIL